MAPPLRSLYRGYRLRPCPGGGNSVVVRSLAVVSNQLESANHLANGEKADAFGKEDTAGGELRVAEAPEVARPGLRGGSEGPHQRRRLLEGVEGGLVVGVESGQGSSRNTPELVDW